MPTKLPALKVLHLVAFARLVNKRQDPHVQTCGSWHFQSTSNDHPVDGFTMLAFRRIDVAAASDTVADVLHENPIGKDRKKKLEYKQQLDHQLAFQHQQ